MSNLSNTALIRSPSTPLSIIFLHGRFIYVEFCRILNAVTQQPNSSWNRPFLQYSTLVWMRHREASIIAGLEPNINDNDDNTDSKTLSQFLYVCFDKMAMVLVGHSKWGKIEPVRIETDAIIYWNIQYDFSIFGRAIFNWFNWLVLVMIGHGKWSLVGPVRPVRDVLNTLFQTCVPNFSFLKWLSSYKS